LSSDNSGCLSWARAIAGIKIAPVTMSEKAKRTRNRLFEVDIVCLPFLCEVWRLAGVLALR
jgi:hypothetical protein